MYLIKKQKGFTLIEQIIVISIVGVLAITAIITFSNTNLRKRQRASVLDFNYNLRRIQNFSLIGKKDPADQVPDAYGIYIEDDNTYIVFADTNGDNIREVGIDTDIQTIDLQSGISIAPTGGTVISLVPKGGFCFDSDNDGPDLPDCSGSTTFNITITGSGINQEVVIDHLSGQVSHDY